MNRLPAALLATASVTAGTYSFLIWRSISKVQSPRISSEVEPLPALLNSKSASIVNPRGHQVLGSSRSVAVRIPKDIEDEVLLSKFVNGFFGGYVFAPEGVVLNLLNARLVDFPINGESDVPPKIWAASQLNHRKLPPLHSVLFGGFQVLDVHIQDVLDSQDQKGTYSYIDFGYHPKTSFAGFHRFSISRNAGDQEGVVTIEFADLVCNPKSNEPVKPAFLMKFHKVYAMLLFRESVVAVMRGL